MCSPSPISLLLFVFVFTLSPVYSDNPGFKASLSPAGLNYATQIAAKVIQQHLSALKIPDATGSDSVPVIGKIEYGVTAIVIHSFSVGAPTFKAAGTAQVAIPGIQVQLSGNWHYKEDNWPHVGDSGSLDVVISNSAVGLVVSVGTSSTGEPTCAAQSVAVYLDNISINVHGGAGWLYNLLVSVFNDNIKDTFSKLIQADITSLINNDLNKALQTLPLHQQISTLGVLDLSLVSAPIVNGYICHPGKGLFSQVPETPPPFGPTVNLPDETSTTTMAQFFLSDYVGNSFFYSLYKTGKLDFVFDNSNLPSGFPKFNTAAFEFLIPTLYFKYPGYNMSATVTPQKSPVVTINPQFSQTAVDPSFNISADFIASVFVISPTNHSFIPVFSLDASLSGRCSINTKGNSLIAQIMAGSVTLSVVSSEIGNFTVGALNAILNTAMTSVLIPKINNGELGTGFLIPVIDGVQLVNPAISSSGGFVVVSSNFAFNGYPMPTLWSEDQ